MTRKAASRDAPDRFRHPDQRVYFEGVLPDTLFACGAGRTERLEDLEQADVVWQGRVGSIPLRVGVPHAERIIAEWDTPQGTRQKVAESMEEFERTVLLQILLSAGERDASATEEVVAAVRKAQSERPRPAPVHTEKRRKNPKVRQHRRSRRPPRRR
jgi:hypothetical protein